MRKYNFNYLFNGYLVNIETTNPEDILGFNLKFGVFFKDYVTGKIDLCKILDVFKVSIEREKIIQESFYNAFSSNYIETTFKSSQFYRIDNIVIENYKGKINIETNLNTNKCKIQISPKFAENKNIIGTLVNKHFSIFLFEKGVCFLHASAIAKNNISVITSGLGGSGKSTIACVANGLGFEVLSDDKTAIDTNKWTILNSLSSIGFDARCKIQPCETSFDFQNVVREEKKNYYCLSNNAKGGNETKLLNNYLLLPVITDRIKPNAYEVNCEEAYRLLLKANSYSAQLYQNDYLDFLLKLCKNSKCYRLFLTKTRNSLDYISSLLQTFCEE